MRSSLSVLLPFLVCLTSGAEESQPGYTLGALFDEDDLQLQAAFLVGTMTKEFLPKSVGVTSGDALDAGVKACQLVQEGVIGIIGPTGKSPSSHVQNICDVIDMPHVVALPDELQSRSSSVVNIYPRPESYSQVIKELIKKKDWTSFTILYQDSEGLSRVENLLHLHSPTQTYDVTIRQLDITDDSYRPTLQDLKQFGETNYVLDCNIDILEQVLVEAQQVGIMSDDHSYIITNLDFHTINLEPFQHGGAEITGLRLLRTDGPEIESFLPILNENWKKSLEASNTEGNTKEIIDVTNWTLRLNIALMYDAVKVYYAGLTQLTQYSDFNFPGLLPGSCDSGRSWIHGSTLVNFMKHSQVEGLTGKISFDTEGFRNNFTLDILQLSKGGIETIGTWNSSDRIVIEQKNAPEEPEKHFIVVTSLSPPYTMLKNSPAELTGNDRYEGFAIELIQELASALKFNYTFTLQEDGNYGSFDTATNVSTGMMKQIRDGTADFAITDLTVTSNRQKAVDFTSPFMNLGISILYKKPQELEPETFSFMAPFSSEVWLLLGTALLGTATLLFALGRLCPSEWQNPYPCIEEPEFLENQFTLSNALWFVLGSVLQQGSEIAPVAYATRMLGSCWWFFTMIMVSSYTANLAAFLTANNKFAAFSSAEELANQDKITYGAKRNGATYTFFRESPVPTYQKMYKYMSEHPEMMTADNDEGLTRVKTSEYAFLMESISIEYMEERHCEVTQVGGLLDSKGYGIAMKKNSPHRNDMSSQILKLQESGKIDEMKRKWWREKRGGGACVGEPEETTKELDLANVGGAFWVLGVGCVCGLFIAALDMLWGVVKRAIKYNVSISQEIKEELKFVVRCSGETKPVRHRRMLESGESSVSSESHQVELAQLAQHPKNTLHPDYARDPQKSQKSQNALHAHHAQHKRRSRSFSPASRFS